MGNTRSFYNYSQIKPIRSDEVHHFAKDINCIIEPKNGKGGIYLGNLKAAENLGLLKCIHDII